MIGSGVTSALDNALFNVDCLHLLERLPADVVDLAYLDPPRSGDVDFAQLDSAIALESPDPSRAGRALRLPEAYLDFLEIRLRHVHRTLKATGFIAVYTSHRDGHNVRILLDSIFGASNHLADFIVPGRSTGTRFGPSHELVIVYGKSQHAAYNPPTVLLSETKSLARAQYDEAGRPYRLMSLTVPARSSPTLSYEWKGIAPPEGHQWRYSQSKMEELDEEGRVVMRPSTNRPMLKQFLDEVQVPIGSIWDDISAHLVSADSTGLMTQQPLGLLERIIQLGTDDGGTVIDPFCGSGTCLVAAHKLGRKWLGCDLSPEAYAISLERLQVAFKLKANRDFIHGDGTMLEQVFPDRSEPSLVSPTSLWIRRRDTAGDPRSTPAEYIVGAKDIRPLILTEGKTDWKHLKAAYGKLREAGSISSSLEIEFFESEESVGDKKLLNDLRADARFQQARLHIYIFDGDDVSIVKKISDTEFGYQKMQENVYSFALPVPQHRAETPEVCIEMYFRDEDLRRTDDEGRRLFLSSEFHPESGRHLEYPELHAREVGKLKGRLKIIDQYVFNGDHRDVALSKDAFAEHILNSADGFEDVDMSAFIAVFDLIARIVEDARPD